MKIFANIMKVLTALAAVAGAVYVVATYGDQIVAWAKKMLASMPKCPTCEEADVVDSAKEETAAAEAVEEVSAEEPAAEEAAEEAPAASAEDFVPAEEVPAEEVPAEQVVVEESEPVAEDTDFEA